jgi:HK97 gp10 family phage protein
MNTDITIDGMEEVVGDLGIFIDTENLEKALKKACALVEREAKKKAPKGVGDLRRSIQSRVEETDGETAGIVFTPLEYAPYVEFGTGLFAEEGGRTDVPWCYQVDKGNWHSTSGMKPSPYLRPALNENKEEI